MQNGAAYFHGKPLPVLKNKLMSYSFSLAKKAAAFFRISRSSLRRWTSFCESLYFFLSLCCFYMLSVLFPFLKSVTHLLRVWLLIPRLSAAAACAYRCYVTSLTASFLNSSVYFLASSFFHLILRECREFFSHNNPGYHLSILRYILFVCRHETLVESW